jgi:hypothetical protein
MLGLRPSGRGDRPGIDGENIMSKRIQEAAAFVESLKLPRKPRAERRLSFGAPKSAADATKQRAMVVGSDIISFVAGTDPALRTAIMNSALLAQLAANKKVPARDDVEKWYEAYFDTLTQIGWVIQNRGFSAHEESGSEFEAHQAILSIAATLLAPAPAALDLVAKTLASMKKLAHGSWITIFQHESQGAKAARFQVTVAGPASSGGAAVSLMAFELAATITLTQVLFFKFRSADVKLRHSSGQVAIDAELLAGVAPKIAARVADYVQAFVGNIPI